MGSHIESRQAEFVLKAVQKTGIMDAEAVKAKLTTDENGECIVSRFLIDDIWDAVTGKYRKWVEREGPWTDDYWTAFWCHLETLGVVLE